jgi:photosystem II stability/assembly factor-like uncharacterized protein
MISVIIKKAILILSLFFSLTQGIAQWNKVYEFPYNMHDLWFINKDTGYIAGSEEVPILMKTTNGGYSWEDITGSISGRIYTITFTDASTGFISYYGSDSQYHLCQTKDAGISWTDKYVTPPYINTIGFGSHDVGYAFPSIMEYADVVKTTDGGNNWVRLGFFQALYPMGGILDCSFPDATNGFIVTGHGAVYRTTSSGVNWNSMYNNYNYSMNGIFFQDSFTGYVAGYLADCYSSVNCGRLLKTTDGGVNWNQKIFNGYCLDLCFTTLDIGYLGNSEGIFKTTTAGDVWNVDTSNYYGYTFKIRAATKEVIYALAYGGQGTCLMKRDPDIGVSSHEGKQKTQLSVYPVPATGLITLNIDVPCESEISIDLLNSQGMQKRQLYYGTLSPGYHQVESSVNGLPEGLYFCRLFTGQTMTIKKIIIGR